MRELGRCGPCCGWSSVFTLIAEGRGWIVLTVAFAIALRRRRPKRAWHGLFHSISAFNNAGFDLMGGFRSLDAVRRRPRGPRADRDARSSSAGSASAIVADIAAKRRWSRLALETKLVLSITALLLATGPSRLLAFEWRNPATLGALPPRPAAVSTRCSSRSRSGRRGWRRSPSAQLTDPSPARRDRPDVHRRRVGIDRRRDQDHDLRDPARAIVSTVRGRPHVEAFGRRVPEVIVVPRSPWPCCRSPCCSSSSCCSRSWPGEAPFLRLVFEAVSAFGTVGAHRPASRRRCPIRAAGPRVDHVHRPARAAELRARPVRAVAAGPVPARGRVRPHRLSRRSCP